MEPAGRARSAVGLHAVRRPEGGIPNISDGLLSERLKELEAEHIVTRDVTPSTPVLIEYHLTDRGRELTRVVDELGRWAERWSVEASRTP